MQTMKIDQNNRHISGFFISKRVAILAVAAFAIILITVSLLVGLIGRRQSQQDANKIPTTSVAPPDPFGDGPWQNNRLPPNSITTNNYKIHIYDVNYTSSSFSGDVEMNFTIKNELEYLLFHVKELQIDKIDLVNQQNVSIGLEKQFEYKKKEYYVLQPKSRLSPGDYLLRVIYRGSTKANVGMYQSTYSEDTDKTVTVIGTKFEPTDARRAFPCFDEPHLKATYDVIIESPIGSYSLSNFPIKVNKTKTSESKPIVYTEFERTFKMSTYLVAWAIVPVDFGYNETMSKNGKVIRVYARKNAVDNGLIDFALDITKKGLDYFENTYFGLSEAVPPKIDMIALPEFPSGAMEHWGLVGFRETRLLFSEKYNSIRNKQDVASTILHELAHFWFGNYVTCEWWNDLWVNEAMADFMALKAVENIFPEWKMDEQIIVDDIIPVMRDDAFYQSHPIEADVQTPDQITTLFDSITYNKGAAILRMLEDVVNASTFQNGIKGYLMKNALGSGVAADFFNNLTLPEEMREKTTPVQFMNTWLKQMNYPKISINIEYNEAQNTTMAVFNQSRFLLTTVKPETDTISPYNYIWEVYLKCKAGGTFDTSTDDAKHYIGEEYDFQYFLNTQKGNYQLPRHFTWIKCNKDFKSFYTTSYPDEFYDAFTTVLKLENKTFSAGDRANLIHVTYQLAYSGEIPYKNPTLLSSYLEFHEKDYVAWKTLIYHFNQIALLLQHRSSFKELSSYGISIAQNLISEFDIWENSGSHLEKLLKVSLLDFICRLDDPDCLSNATVQFKKISESYFTNGDQKDNPIAPDMRLSIYRYHMKNENNYRDWERLKSFYSKFSLDPQEKSNALSALSYSERPWILNSYLKELRDNSSIIRRQDYFTALNAISRNSAGRYLAWFYLRHNWNGIVEKFGIQDRTFGRSIKVICETFENEFLLSEVIDFFAKYPDAGAGTLPRKQALEIVKNNMQWITKQESSLVQNFITPSLH